MTVRCPAALAIPATLEVAEYSMVVESGRA